jgi:type VI secretion system lysozyme-like protein
MTQKTSLLFEYFNDPDKEIRDHYLQQSKDYKKKSYIESIVFELTRLLNTRQPFKRNITDLLTNSHTVIIPLPQLYGMPDFQSFDPSNTLSKIKMLMLYKKMIAYYEPRIVNPEVQINHFDIKKQKMFITISGEILFDHEHFPFATSLTIKH